MALSHATPSAAPMQTSTVFHTALTSAVSSRKRIIGILANPAGTEIRLRTMGMHRQISTALPWYLVNQ